MTDAELLELARRAVPDDLKSSGQVVHRLATAHDHTLEAVDKEDLLISDDLLIGEMAELLGIKPPPATPPDADSGNVVFHEDTPLGRRTTVVQVRQGKVVRLIGQA